MDNISLKNVVSNLNLDENGIILIPESYISELSDEELLFVSGGSINDNCTNSGVCGNQSKNGVCSNTGQCDAAVNTMCTGENGIIYNP